MDVTVDDIIRLMERLAPTGMAESWDNVGMQIGDPSAPVQRIWVTLDPLPEVVERACRQQVDLLITHHPLLFKPLSRIDFSTPTGRIIQLAALHRLSIFAAHTNLDSVEGGVNDRLAAGLELQDVAVLAEPVSENGNAGIGRIGTLRAPCTLKDLALRLKSALHLPVVKVSGPDHLAVRRVALCTGSGGGLISHFLASNAEVFLSGDLKYHDAREVESRGRGLIDIGHFASEHIITGDLARRLQAAADQAGTDVSVEAPAIETDPFFYV